MTGIGKCSARGEPAGIVLEQFGRAGRADDHRLG